MRAGLRAMVPRASPHGMKGKPSEVDFTHHICSHTELWSVGMMLGEDFHQFWVVPSCVFHLHPPKPLGRSMTCRYSPDLSSSMGRAGDTGVLPAADSVQILPLMPRSEGAVIDVPGK